MALDTRANIKTTLGITGTGEDSKLDIMLSAADSAIKLYVGFDIESRTYGTGATATDAGVGDSGYYSGDDHYQLVLRQRPVTSITSVYLDPTGRFGDNPDGAFASSELLVAGTDYVLRWDGTLPGATTRCSRCGILEKLSGVWPGLRRHSIGAINASYSQQNGNIKITYVAGYTTVPADIKYALALVVAKMRQTASFGGDALTSESYEDYSYKLGSGNSGGAQSAIMQLGEVRSILARYRDITL